MEESGIVYGRMEEFFKEEMKKAIESIKNSEAAGPNRMTMHFK